MSPPSTDGVTGGRRSVRGSCRSGSSSSPSATSGRAVVSNLTLEVGGGRALRAARAVGERQEHGAAADRRPRRRRLRPHPARRRDLAGVPARERGLGFVFQSYALFRRMTVAENVEFALAVRGRARRAPAAARRAARAGRARRARRPLCRTSSPADSSSAWRWRARSPTGPSCCCSTSRSARSTRASASTCGAACARSSASCGSRRSSSPTTRRRRSSSADRIAVLAQGRLVEEGPPRELYLRPHTEFVATFLGGANLLVGQSTPLRRPARAGRGAARGGGRAPRAPAPRVQVLFRPGGRRAVAERARRDEPRASPSSAWETVEEIAFVGRQRAPAAPPARAPRRARHPAAGALRRRPVRSTPCGRSTRRGGRPLAPGDRVRVGVRRLHALLHPGLSFLVERGGGAAEAYAAELARLAQARLRSVERFEELLARRRRRAGRPSDLVVAAARRGDVDADRERLLEAGGGEHLLLVRGAAAAAAAAVPGRGRGGRAGQGGRRLRRPPGAPPRRAGDGAHRARARRRARRARAPPSGSSTAACARSAARRRGRAGGGRAASSRRDARRARCARTHDLLVARRAARRTTQGRLRWGRAARALLDAGARASRS